MLRKIQKAISIAILIAFIATTVKNPAYAQAVGEPMPTLPIVGTMVNLSPAYEPALIKGLTVHKDNPFLFDFIVDVGDSKLGPQDPKLKAQADQLIKYFFACLTIPEKDLWVNLSPYEKNRMVPQALGQTALGRDLLAQDYILKQLTASLIYPEKNLGKEFWNRIYAKAQAQYGTNQIPVNTFNKVWIMADKAAVYEHGQTAFVVDSHLKVMLEEDYQALQKHGIVSSHTHSISSKIIRQLILPEIEHEVNTGKNFAMLRQIYNSLILASWYKNNLKQALLNQVYADKSTVNGIKRQGVIPAKAGIQNQDLSPNQIYQQYLKAYKKGVFNYIKEDAQADGQTIPHKYFSGGFLTPANFEPVDITSNTDGRVAQAMISIKHMLAIFTAALVLNTASSALAQTNTVQASSIARATTNNQGNSQLETFNKFYPDTFGFASVSDGQNTNAIKINLFTLRKGIKEGSFVVDPTTGKVSFSKDNNMGYYVTAEGFAHNYALENIVLKGNPVKLDNVNMTVPPIAMGALIRGGYIDIGNEYHFNLGGISPEAAQKLVEESLKPPKPFKGRAVDAKEAKHELSLFNKFYPEKNGFLSEYNMSYARVREEIKRGAFVVDPQSEEVSVREGWDREKYLVHEWENRARQALAVPTDQNVKIDNMTNFWFPPDATKIFILDGTLVNVNGHVRLVGEANSLGESVKPGKAKSDEAMMTPEMSMAILYGLRSTYIVGMTFLGYAIKKSISTFNAAKATDDPDENVRLYKELNDNISFRIGPAIMMLSIVLIGHHPADNQALADGMSILLGSMMTGGGVGYDTWAKKMLAKAIAYRDAKTPEEKAARFQELKKEENFKGNEPREIMFHAHIPIYLIFTAYALIPHSPFVSHINNFLQNSSLTFQVVTNIASVLLGLGAGVAAARFEQGWEKSNSPIKRGLVGKSFVSTASFMRRFSKMVNSNLAMTTESPNSRAMVSVDYLQEVAGKIIISLQHGKRNNVITLWEKKNSNVTWQEPIVWDIAMRLSMAINARDAQAKSRPNRRGNTIVLELSNGRGANLRDEAIDILHSWQKDNFADFMKLVPGESAEVRVVWFAGDGDYVPMDFRLSFTEGTKTVDGYRLDHDLWKDGKKLTGGENSLTPIQIKVGDTVIATVARIKDEAAYMIRNAGDEVLKIDLESAATAGVRALNAKAMTASLRKKIAVGFVAAAYLGLTALSVKIYHLKKEKDEAERDFQSQIERNNNFNQLDDAVGRTIEESITKPLNQSLYDAMNTFIKDERTSLTNIDKGYRKDFERKLNAFQSMADDYRKRIKTVTEVMTSKPGDVPEVKALKQAVSQGKWKEARDIDDYLRRINEDVKRMGDTRISQYDAQGQLTAYWGKEQILYNMRGINEALDYEREQIREHANRAQIAANLAMKTIDEWLNTLKNDQLNALDQIINASFNNEELNILFSEYRDLSNKDKNKLRKTRILISKINSILRAQKLILPGQDVEDPRTMSFIADIVYHNRVYGPVESLIVYYVLDRRQFFISRINENLNKAHDFPMGNDRRKVQQTFEKAAENLSKNPQVYTSIIQKQSKALTPDQTWEDVKRSLYRLSKGILAIHAEKGIRDIANLLNRILRTEVPYNEEFLNGTEEYKGGVLFKNGLENPLEFTKADMPRGLSKYLWAATIKINGEILTIIMGKDYFMLLRFDDTANWYEKHLSGKGSRSVRGKPNHGRGNSAMTVDKAALATDFKRGGIDLNTANMGMTVTKDANGGVQVLTQSKELGLLIARIKAQGIQSAVPVIINVKSMSPAQLRPLLELPQ